MIDKQQDMNVRGVNSELLKEFKKACIDSGKPMKMVVQELMAAFTMQNQSQKNLES